MGPGSLGPSLLVTGSFRQPQTMHVPLTTYTLFNAFASPSLVS
jgi:hypothetical protein